MIRPKDMTEAIRIICMMESRIDKLESVGLNPKGRPMPQTMDDWRYLACLYGKGMEIEAKQNSVLRAENNKLKQKLNEKVNEKVKS